jgi:2-polyprenyl-6-methoxyphenol hydroxylase-like FAD-dependent oxidoreductase
VSARAGRDGSHVTPVAIIGGGVVGLSMAVALWRHGVSSVVLERSAAPNDHPRAHVANPRTLELFRLWGVEREVRAAGLPAEATGNFVWMSAISGHRLGEIRYADGHRDLSFRDRLTVTPEVSCAQDVIEQILRDRLRSATGRDVSYGTNVVAAETLPTGGVELAVEGRGQAIRARYAIAADGAGSLTRRSLGIEMEGPEQLAHFVSMYVRVDLSRWTEQLPAVLYWIVNSRVQGVFISMDGHSRYVFHLRIDPARERAESFTTDRCRSILRDAIGSDDPDVEIVQVGQWLMSGQLAERYRDRDIFLVGDSAHRFPPTGGFGMNTGIQDAHNLAWKLAAVIAGWAPDSLLDSYEAERRPIAEVNRTRSVANFERLEDLATWSLDPLPIIRRLESLGADGEAERARFTKEIESQREHFDKIAQEIGFVYREGALVPELDAAVNGDRGYIDRDAITHAQVGARAPLVRFEGSDGTEVATTDLFEREFVLIANGDSVDWEPATRALAATGVPSRYLEVGRDLIDTDGDWAEISGTQPGGALLVRPDGHIAYRAVRPPHDPKAALRQATARVLGGVGAPVGA